MADIYDRAKAQAARMLAPRSAGGKGLELTLRRTVVGEYDPDTGSSETITDYIGSGLRENYRMEDIDGSLVKAGDVRFMVSPVLLNGDDMPEPKTLDKVLFDGETYTVQRCDPGDYAGLSCFFYVQARK
ncbi:hypothetical protein ACUTAF_02125 [Pseudomonas sp. SP16.1]|uniref:hypothetical protein n=1 Tax=Pseudomonas sp. SP16.1 TaxID=3458854 RepID=UPI0040465A4D